MIESCELRRDATRTQLLVNHKKLLPSLQKIGKLGALMDPTM